MTIDLKEIKNKYPKGFEKLLFYHFDKDYPDEINQESKKYMIDTICYCDIEKFFDDNGIIISILYRNVISNNIDKWYFKMYDDYGNDTSEGCKTRSEAKEQAIYKAFKILEERLNGKENIRSENI